jgi:hypothetical protein
MTAGPGKYDDLCTYVREQAGARAALVVVIDGNRGAGFSCQAEAELMLAIAAVLEGVAEEIRRETSRSSGNSN